MDQMHWDGYFFVTRIKKNTKVHVIDTLETSPETEILRDELVRLGSKTYLTANFRLVTVQDNSRSLANRIVFQAHQTTHDH
nr:hypothetical protein [Enterococcus lactis]